MIDETINVSITEQLILYFMCDVMPELNKSAKIFQLGNFDYAKVNNLLKALYKYFDTLISEQNKAKSFQ